MDNNQALEMMKRCQREIEQRDEEIRDLRPKAEAYDVMRQILGLASNRSGGYAVASGAEIRWTLRREIEKAEAIQIADKEAMRKRAEAQKMQDGVKVPGSISPEEAAAIRERSHSAQEARQAGVATTLGETITDRANSGAYDSPTLKDAMEAAFGRATGVNQDTALSEAHDEMYDAQQRVNVKPTLFERLAQAEPDWDAAFQAERDRQRKAVDDEAKKFRDDYGHMDRGD